MLAACHWPNIRLPLPRSRDAPNFRKCFPVVFSGCEACARLLETVLHCNTQTCFTQGAPLAGTNERTIMTLSKSQVAPEEASQVSFRHASCLLRAYWKIHLLLMWTSSVAVVAFGELGLCMQVAAPPGLLQIVIDFLCTPQPIYPEVYWFT